MDIIKIMLVILYSINWYLNELPSPMKIIIYIKEQHDSPY